MRDSAPEEFRAAVLEHFRLEGRSFPWRDTLDPWSILVSEFMLQQTQTSRVLPKYLRWMETWPDPTALAAAPLSEVYAAWSGLGYNSRALRLREAARAVAAMPGGRLPGDENALLALPGVGPYTARAVLAFAWRKPVILVETNIRAAVIFHFFRGREAVRDRELEPVLDAVMDRSDPRTWYYALMDYGAWLKKREPNPSRASAGYARQGAFRGSAREARGAVLRAVSSLSGTGAGLDWLEEHSGLPRERLERAAGDLVAEGLLSYRDGRFSFPD